MVVQHEHQHIETMLATLQLRDAAYPLPATPAPAGDPDVEGEIAVAGGAFTIGTDDEPWAYDNERPAHEAIVDPFRIDRTPVTNRAYLEFVAAGGYRDDTAWSDAGRAWRDDGRARTPGVLARGARRLVGTATLRSLGAGAARRARATRLLVRSRRLRPLGGQAPADRDRVGVRGVMGRDPRHEVTVPVGRRARRRRPGQSRRHAVRARSRREPPRPA